jgi:hypothetical protein
LFFKGSRYWNLPTATYEGSTGRTVTYVTTRYIGPITSFVTHSVVDGERLDLVAQQAYRDPQRFWRIADANLATWPPDIMVPGAVIDVPPSEG